MLHPIPDKTEIHRLIDLPQQVMLRHQRLDRYPLTFLLLQLRLLQHQSTLRKAPVQNESLSWYFVSSLRPRQKAWAPITSTRLPDAARIRWHHRLAYLTAKRLTELFEVLHRALGPPFPGAMRIRLRQHSRILLCLVLTPYLTKGDEEPLRWCIAVLFSVHIARFCIRSALGQNLLECLERNTNTTVV